MRSLLLAVAVALPLAITPLASAQANGLVQARIVGLEVPSIPNAPFTAKDFVTWTETLPGGGTVATKYYTVIARDSAGNVRRETRRRVPANSQQDPLLTTFILIDPGSHSRADCTVATRICRVSDFRPVTHLASLPAGRLPGDRFLTRENLGRQDHIGLPTTGTRDTITTLPNAKGNSGALIETDEYWLSPELGMYLSAHRDQPQFGQLTLNIGELVRGEPDPSLLTIPPNYQIIDARASAALH